MGVTEKKNWKRKEKIVDILYLVYEDPTQWILFLEAQAAGLG